MQFVNRPNNVATDLSTNAPHTDFYIIIPARMNSKRLPNKMLLDIGGIPLIVRTAIQAQKSQAIRVIVATDHPDIESECRAHNIESIMTSQHHQTGTDRIAEAVKLLKLTADTIIINVQGDEPLIDPKLINELASFISSKQKSSKQKSSTPEINNTSSVTTKPSITTTNNMVTDKNIALGGCITPRVEIATIAHKIIAEHDVFNPNIVKVVVDKDQNALYFSRAPIPFCRDNIATGSNLSFTHINLLEYSPFLRHIGIYAYTVNFLNNYSAMPISPLENLEKLEQLRILYNGEKIAVLTTNNVPASGVDTHDDLIQIRKLIINS